MLIEGSTEAVASARKILSRMIQRALPIEDQKGSELWQANLHNKLDAVSSKRKVGLGFNDSDDKGTIGDHNSKVES